MRHTVPEWLDDTAKRLPEKEAFADETSSLTFSALKEMSDAVATALSVRGYHKEPVLICMQKTPAFIGAMCGILGAGLIFVPAQEELSATRIRHMKETTGARVMICDTAGAKKVMPLEDIDILMMEDITRTPAEEALLCERRKELSKDDLCYVMFTSGSTGTPKGVAVTHASLAAYMEALLEVMPFSEDSIFAGQTPFFTDACFKEIFATILLGATTHIVPARLFSYPALLTEFLNAHRINTICWASSALSIVAVLDGFCGGAPKALTTVAFTSEVLPPDHLRYWMEHLSAARFFNLYGPTEGTGVCCAYPVTDIPRGEERIPLGTPLKGIRVCVMTEDGTLTDAKGAEGELVISGAQIARGYVGGADFHGTYHTGDRVRIGADALLYFAGRMDRQIKRMGYRIEPAEIESCAMREGSITRAAVYQEKDTGRLVLCYTGKPDEGAVRAYLKEQLARYMMPQVIKRLKEMPLTATGKPDFAALSSMTGTETQT